MDKETLLITGASGFIGSHIAEEALALGFDVWVAVRKTSSRGYLTDERLHFIELDMQHDETLLKQLLHAKQELGGCAWKYVVHAAGATKCLKREDFFEANTKCTRNLVNALSQVEMQPERFVFMSSLSVMGAIKEKQIDGVYPDMCETDTPQPNTAYAESKLMAEQELKESGLKWVILRPTGVYGPREKDYFLMAQSVARHSDFAVGFKKQDLTFVYVKDLVQAVFASLANEAAVGHTFLISDGRVYDSTEFSDLIRKELGNPWMLRVRMPVCIMRIICMVCGTVARMLGKVFTLNMDKYHILVQRNWRCDILPACDILQYTPHYFLEDGVKETISWYKENKWL